jgi:putative inorganic carbon (hco3(-)) transporter
VASIADYSNDRVVSRPDDWLTIGVAVSGGLAATALVTVASSSPKALGSALVSLAFVIAVTLSRHRGRLCVLALVVLAPLPMHAFLVKLEPLHNGGALGVYIKPADIPLLLLYVGWLLEAAVHRRTAEARSSKYALVFLPFLFLGGLSISYSEEPVWAFAEWTRWVKFAAILFYAVNRVPTEDIEFCIKAVAASAALESTIALLQTAMRSNLGLDRLGIRSAEAFMQSLGDGVQVVRGGGVSGHPNLLGSYLVLCVPIFLMLMLVDRRRLSRAIWATTAVLAIGGLGVTMSRAAWVAGGIALALAAMLTLAYRLIDVKRALRLTAVSLAIAGSVAAAFYPYIMKRWHSDFSDSWALRKELNQTALEIVSDHPVFGVGLNNYTIVYPRYAHYRAWLMVEQDGLLTVAHNLYLLIWSELGTLGLAAFAFFWIAIAGFGLVSMSRAGPIPQAVIGGVLAGNLGLLLGDVAGFSFWTDINLYTSALLIGLLEPLSRWARA